MTVNAGKYQLLLEYLVQSAAWLDAGYKVSDVKLGELIIFEKM